MKPSARSNRLTALLATGVALVALGATPALAKKLSPTLAGSANLLIKSQLDSNFCIEVGSGTGEGRTLALEQCGLADTQRWTLTRNADETNLIVESQGMCVDGNQRPADAGLPLPVDMCRMGAPWRFSMDASGLIQNGKSGKCLSIPGAASNVAVSLAECDENKPTQRWKLAH